MDLKAQLESILFLAAKPLSIKSLVKILGASAQAVDAACRELAQDYQAAGRGIQLARIEDQVQMTTSPENTRLIESYLKEELSGELTRPQLETLTVVAYRGPIGRIELEAIRGVNCGLILRNLLLRGLVEEKIDAKTKNQKYFVTFDFLKFLGVSVPSQLPDYEKLSSSEILEKWLESQRPGQGAESALPSLSAGQANAGEEKL